MRKIQSLIAVLLIMSLLFSAQAADGVDNDELSYMYYTDVADDCIYAEAINYLTENEIVQGVGDGQFSPDRPITREEYAIMLLRLFIPEKATQCERTGVYFNTLRNYACVLQEEWKLNACIVTWDVVLRTAFEASSVYVYPQWLYEDTEPVLDYVADIKYTLAQNKVFAEDFDWSKTPTRGEVAHLLYLLHTQRIDTPIPWKYAEIGVTIVINDEKPPSYPDGNSYGAIRNFVLYELTMMPYKYVDAFNQDGWCIYITHATHFEEMGYEYAVGLCHYTDKTVYLDASTEHFESHLEINSVLHEFGHYVDNRVPVTLDKTYMYRFESEAMAELIRDYAKEDKEECFAEAFRYVLANRDDPIKYAEMQEVMPMALAYIEKAYLDAEELWNRDVLNAVTTKYVDRYSSDEAPSVGFIGNSPDTAEVR